MKEKNVFGQIKFWRKFTVDGLNETPERDCYETPTGFANNLLWNAGHILVTYDEYISTLAGGEKQLEDRYYHWFSTGSSPTDWENDLPQIEDIAAKLEAQVAAMERTCTGRLEADLSKPLTNEDTVEDLLCFLMSHECYHLGVMRSIKRLASA